MKYIKLYEEVIKDKIPIPIDVKEIAQIFSENGYDLFVVGGAVRDFIMGKEPHDYDLVTNAQPSRIIEILEDKYRLGLHGRHFAVIRVFTNETPEGLEIASYRKDIAKGRDNKFDPDNPKVEFGRHISIRDDVLRRDLTCNALYYDIMKEKIVDIVGGLNDIRNGIIRAVGVPRDRFREDRLRILRTFRFAARSNSKIDTETSQAIKDDNRLNGISEIDDVSQERVIDEFYGTVEKPGMLMWCQIHDDKSAWYRYLKLLKEYKMFIRMFPDTPVDTKFYKTLNELIIFTKIFSKNKPTKDFHDKLVYELKLPGRIGNSVVFLLNIKNLFTDKNINVLFDPDDRYNNIISLYRNKLDIGLDNETIIEYGKFANIDKKYINAFTNYTVTTDTNELMDMGFKGRALGDEIKKIETEKFKALIK